MKRFRFCVFLFPLFFLSSCKVEPVVPKSVENVKFDRIDPLKGIVVLDMGLRINNPNKFSITVYHLDVDITVGGVPLGKVSMDDKFKIRKDTEEVYPVKVNAQIRDIITGIPKLLAAVQKKQTDVTAKGSIKVGSGIFRKIFPFDIDQKKVPAEDANKK
ncbi:MAG TPA: LEA type 2 family protein [Bacteroidia bacterium]|nr:LEA type 2 family protein [Bacteroidia bacterium]